jgi:flagellar export protein FliJ
LDEGLRELADIEDKVQEYRKNFKMCQEHGDLDSETLKLHLRYLTHLSVTKKMKAQDIANRQLELDKRKDVLIKIMKDKKVIEKLKDRKLKEYTKDFQTQDQKILDESGVNRFVRQHKNEE